VLACGGVDGGDDRHITLKGDRSGRKLLHMATKKHEKIGRRGKKIKMREKINKTKKKGKGERKIKKGRGEGEKGRGSDPSSS
jgi:hypothetical protein